MVRVPKVDNRTATEIAAQIRELLPRYVTGWEEQGATGGAAEAMIGIFARYCEIIIERLNKAPEKNLIAFLNLLGASPAPPQPARVPLTFYPAAQSIGELIVPALTQAAAPPAKGETEPVVFETERELVVAPARLAALWVRDDPHDRYANYSDLLDQTALPPPKTKITDSEFFALAALHLTGKPPAPDQVAEFVADTAADKRQRIADRIIARLPAGLGMFIGNSRFDHFLFIAIEPVSTAPVWNELRLKFVLKNDSAPHEAGEGSLEWLVRDGLAGRPLKPDSDSTQGLSRSGEVVFLNLAAPPLTSVNGRAGRWLQVSWKAPEISTQDAKLPPADSLPVIQTITVFVQTEQKPQRLEQAFLNSLPVDLSKDFFPLGEKPKFGDTLYLSSPLFSAPGAAVTLLLELTNPASMEGRTPVPAVKPITPKLQWECWDGAEWTAIGVSEFARVITPSPAPPSRLRIDHQDAPSPPEQVPGDFSDSTRALVESGKVSFRLPYPREQSAVGGKAGYWIRVRLVSGDYGHDVRYEVEPGRGPVVTPATFAPPVVHIIQVQQELKAEGPAAALVTYNDFTYRDVTAESFAPFVISAEPQRCCYLGLQPVSGRFPGRSMSFYLALANPAKIDVDTLDKDRPPAMWEYWNGKAWTPRTVQDDTGGLRHSGIVRFLAPADFSASVEFGDKLFWLRARKVEGMAFEPRLRRILLNTVMASHTQTTAGEVLGSGTGRPNQIFRTARKPLLEGQILEVLEPTPPSSREREQIEREEGTDAITETAPVRGRIEAWVRWHAVPDFQSSGPRDRHYVLNRDTGEVVFGDGVAGLAPPALTGNVRMARYSTGGGSVGNKPAASIVQLKTTVPYVERVANLDAADGGADVETVASVMDRAPREIRHGGRAVTPEDFEDLAQRASMEVARAKCLPLCDLDQDPSGTKRIPGVISLIVVPRWAEGAVRPKPPSAELFARVREFLNERRFRSLKLVLAAPDYIRIDIKAEINVENVDTTSQMELAVILALGRFLHPLTGLDGNGWAFGRLPAKSDLYPVIENVPGVDHVRSLEMATSASSFHVDRPDVEQTDIERRRRFLIYAGDIQVAATLEN